MTLTQNKTSPGCSARLNDGLRSERQADVGREVQRRGAAAFQGLAEYADENEQQQDGSAGPAGDVRAAVLHLVWQGVFRADQSVPLSAATRLERAA